MVRPRAEAAVLQRARRCFKTSACFPLDAGSLRLPVTAKAGDGETWLETSRLNFQSPCSFFRAAPEGENAVTPGHDSIGHPLTFAANQSGVVGGGDLTDFRAGEVCRWGES